MTRGATDGWELVIDGIDFGEGPRWHLGRLWFSDFYQGTISSVGHDRQRRIEVEYDGRPSGLGWLPDGRLLFVSMLDRRVMRRDADGTIVEHADLDGIATGHCNDMVVGPQGNAYVGNFGFDLDATLVSMGPEGLFAAMATDPAPYTTVLARVDLDGTVTVAADDLAFPNGVVLVDGGSTLVVAQSLGLELTAFDKGPDGSLTNRRTWAPLAGEERTVVPDGIDADDAGGIWVADAFAPEVVRVEEGGRITHRVTTSQQAFACALGGPDRRHLLVCTAASSLAEEAAAEPRGKLELAVL